MLRFLNEIRRVIPLTKNSFLPALLMVFGLIGFNATLNLSELILMPIHYTFYITAIICLSILVYTNNAKPVMFILITLITYIIINVLKKKFGENYSASPYYLNIYLISPINFIICYLLPKRKLFIKENTYILLAFLIELALFEFFSKNNLALSKGMSLSIGLLTFMAGAILLVFIASRKGRIIDTYIMYAYIEIMFGFIYSDNPTGLSLLFCIAMITIFIGTIYETYYSTFNDVLTSLSNRNAYIVQSKEFPLKYSVGIICIDDYKQLSKGLKSKEKDALVTLIANRITNLERDNLIYRYDEHEFVIVFKNENRNESFNRIETIRRDIASSEFFLSKQKRAFKATVSGSVSEKKRSDDNPFEALVRSRKALEKTNKFSQNVSVKA